MSKIGSLIGRVMMADENTKDKTGVNFARILVEVKIDNVLNEKVMLKNERGLLIEQKVEYEWKPLLYMYCNKYGHRGEECRKNVTRLVVTQNADSVGEETQRDAAPTQEHRVQVQMQNTQRTIGVTTSNPFEALNVNKGPDIV